MQLLKITKRKLGGAITAHALTATAQTIHKLTILLGMQLQGLGFLLQRVVPPPHMLEDFLRYRHRRSVSAQISQLVMHMLPDQEVVELGIVSFKFLSFYIHVALLLNSI